MRRKADVKTTLLCATRFWSLGWRERDNSTPTLRRGVRSVVRKQGFTAAEISKAERELIREGKLEYGARGSGTTLRLTDKGNSVSCSRVRLAPWTDAGYPGAQLGNDGVRRTPPPGARFDPPPRYFEPKGPPPGVPLRGARRRRRRR